MASEDYNQKDLELIKFYMDCAFKEAALFWNRNSVLLLANLATFSAAFAYLSGSDEPVSWFVRIGICLFGCSLCTIWVFVIRASRRMNHGWTYQAQQLAEATGHNGLNAALNSVPSAAAALKKLNVSSEGEDKKVKNIPSATIMMYWLAAVFAVVWVIISLVGKGGII